MKKIQNVAINRHRLVRQVGKQAASLLHLIPSLANSAGTLDPLLDIQTR